MSGAEWSATMGASSPQKSSSWIECFLRSIRRGRATFASSFSVRSLRGGLFCRMNAHLIPDPQPHDLARLACEQQPPVLVVGMCFENGGREILVHFAHRVIGESGCIRSSAAVYNTLSKCRPASSCKRSN